MLLNNFFSGKNCFWQQMLNMEVANLLCDCEGKNRCNKLFFVGGGQRLRWTWCNYNTSRRFIITGLYPQSLGRFEWQTSAGLLFIKRYNLYKLLACSTTFFQLTLFCATFFQLRTFLFFISSKTSSSQLVLGLPIGLLDMGFHLLILCTVLSSAMRSTWPNQFMFWIVLIQWAKTLS